VSITDSDHISNNPNSIHNKFVQTKILESKEYFENLFVLYNGWFDFRIKNNLAIPSKENKLTL